MACSENGGSNILLCLGIFVVASLVCHCATLTRLKTLDKLRENSTFSQGQDKGHALHNGRLLIGQNSLQGVKLKGTKATEILLDVDTDYQADMGWTEPKQPKGQGESFLRPRSDDAAVERLLKMEPKVECTEDSMKLQVQDATSTPGSLFFVDRGSHLSPLPLSKLPPSCGYSIRSTRRDLVLVAPYDGCFVALEEDSYVLPLRWWGVPVRMSCPLMRPSSPNPPMVTCYAEGMVVKMEWTASVAKIKVNLNGNWELLMKASPRCGFSVVVHPEGVVISVHYVPCLEKKDGLYTLELAANGETKISCPSLLAPQIETTKGPQQQTEMPYRGLPLPTPPYNSGSTQSPPAVPGFPQVPGIPNEKPNQGPKDINQPQLPHYPFYPHFYPYPDIKPTPAVQPVSSPVTKRNGLQSQQTIHPPNLPVAPGGQVPQPFIPLPFYPWPTQPEKVPVEKEPPVQRPDTQPPNDKVEKPFYPYPYYILPPKTNVSPVHRPEPEPIPTASPPVVQTRQQPYYPIPFFPQPPKPETPPTQPPVTKPPPSKLDEHVPPNPFNPPFGLPQKPVGPPVIQPGGQEQKHFIQFPFFPQPPASEVKQPLQPLYPDTPKKPLPEKTVPPKPPVFQEPQGQIYPSFNQYPFYFPFLPQGPYQTQMPPTQQTSTPAPKGQAQQTPSPLQPEASKPKVPSALSPSKPPESKGPSHPEAPQGQVHQYLYPLYPQPDPSENQPATQPTAVQQPPQPETPWGQVYNMYPYHFLYSQPKPENQPVEKPVHKPSYPQPSKIPGAGPNGAKTPIERPVPSEQPPGVQPPDGQGYHPFHPQQPQFPQPITLPPASSMQQPQQVAITPPSNGGIGPQPGLFCPQFCPSGFTNCCPQIAFHQHLHHIVPAGLVGKDTPPVHPALPFLPSVAMTAQVSTSSTSVPTSLQSHPPGNEKQPHLLPPDGNPAALPGGVPQKPSNPELPMYPYSILNLQYPNWPYLPQNENVQNLLQRLSAAHYNVPSKPQAPVKDPVNPVVQYGPYYIQSPVPQMRQLSPGDMNNPNFMSSIGQYRHQEHIANQKREPTAKELQPSNKKSSDLKGQTHPKVQSELDRYMVPYYMLQDAQAPADNSSQPQPFVSGLKKSTKHEQTEPKSYVLLQRGPPGREPNSFSDSPLPFRDLGHDTNFLAQNFARHNESKPQHPQNLNPPQDKSQHPKWLEKMSSPLPASGNYMPRPGDESESLPLRQISASDGLHFVPLPQDPSFSEVHLKPKFTESLKEMWKPITPLGSNRRIPAHVPEKAFQRWSSAADHQD
ncbi:MAGE-like protein 2 isoform X2 [Lates calcarifer]|uniref:MAGE-like protein 2 isoform X2 n=1 Tax=Lates calcarifer TaxID=8187 RepID=A0AAJ7LX80_LATCA|nr:MAGE-like protein 2 isoform X2 [Lates calcarifer]